jgi:uncharacterized membrane protein
VLYGYFSSGLSFTLIKTTGTPFDIARARYAKGEITKEELEEIKRNLEK